MKGGLWSCAKYCGAGLILLCFGPSSLQRGDLHELSSMSFEPFDIRNETLRYSISIVRLLPCVSLAVILRSTFYKGLSTFHITQERCE
jgi:hypothetical protein